MSYCVTATPSSKLTSGSVEVYANFLGLCLGVLVKGSQQSFLLNRHRSISREISMTRNFAQVSEIVIAERVPSKSVVIFHMPV